MLRLDSAVYHLDHLLGGYLASNIGMGKRSSTSIKKTFRFADLFAGIGGMRLAFEAAGGECVYTSEWNKFSQETYRANFQSGVSHKYDTDITKVCLLYTSPSPRD